MRSLAPALPAGPWLAAALLAGWMASLVALLTSDLDLVPPLAAAGAVLLRTLLQTGLFIVGHDAMHGSLLPGQRRGNDRLGRLALALYAGLPYGRCRRQHRLHHRAPGTARDPDFHGLGRTGALAWYRRFMGGYLGPGPLLTLLTGWGIGAWAASAVSPTAVANVLLFWTLPLLLSSLQLFLFGTYLPHRHGGRPGGDRHHAISLDWPEPLSLLACFHFGYHWEHHEHPHLAWYRLPAARRRRRRALGR